MTVDEFVRRWRVLVRRWTHCRDVAGVSHALLRDALHFGLESVPPFPDGEDVERITAEDALDCEIAVLRLSGLVDEKGYIENIIPNVRRPDPVAHFCTDGWQRLANPSIDFDVWWYSFAHLGLGELRVNPLLHYALVGRREGLSTRGETATEFTRAELPSDRPIRRACLFAAYDVDGIVDDYVVDYLSRLRTHCDIFYLADSFLTAAELAKLDDLVVDRWAIPHGRYDFGSYAMLAKDLVGWKRLDGYDEVILANDSCYALTDFDHVFERMDKRACDWWGFQASKLDFSREKGNASPIDIATAKEQFVGRPEWRQMLHLHLSSYFLTLRRPAFQDPQFRQLIEQVNEQPSKTSIVLKYEIGLTRALLQSSHDFDTYVGELYPFHPVYNADAFKLIAEGFPFLKRTFLVENSTKTPGLSEWKDRTLELVPEAPVELIARNLERVGAHDQLTSSFAVVTGPDGEVDAPRLLPPRRMKRADDETPTFEHWWAFPVSVATHNLSTDARAIFEQIRNDPSIKKVVLTRSRRMTLPSANTSIVPLNSPEGQEYLLRAGLVLVSDPPAEAVPFPISDDRHTFVDIAGGSTLLRPERRDHPGSTSRETFREPRVSVGLAGSALGSVLTAHQGTSDRRFQVLRTGAPRADFVSCPENELPEDLVEDVERVRSEVDGRRLILVAPTGPLPDGLRSFGSVDLGRLQKWLERKNAILGLREASSDRSRTYARLLSPLQPIDVSSRRFPHVEVLYRLIAAVISDYGTSLQDFLLTGRPVIPFAPSYDSDRSAGRVLVDLDRVMPSPISTTLDGLLDSLERAFDSVDGVQRARYEWCRDLFADYDDGHNAWRAVLALRTLRAARRYS